jgi:iron(III) transport system substrate-binding protein
MNVLNKGWRLAAGCVLALVLGSAGAQAPKGKLVLYTSQPERDASQTVSAYRRAYPGVEVELFRSGTTEVMAKLAAEFAAGQPKPDVLLLADAATMEALKKDGRLQAYPEAKVSGLDAGIYDKDRTYFGSKLITTGIAVNTAAKTRPTSWADLAKPEYKGQIAMPSPLYSGAAAIMLGTMTTRPDLGWGFFEKLKASDAVAAAATAPCSAPSRTARRPTACSSTSWRSTPRPRARRSTSSCRRRDCPR